MPEELPELFPFPKNKQNTKTQQPPPDKKRREGGCFRYVCIVSVLCIFAVGLQRDMISLYPR